MNAIEGTFKGGQIVPDGPMDWPEGCRLYIVPVSTDEGTATTDSDESETPEQIEDWLRWYHALEPLEFTPEEEAELASWRQKVKEYEANKSQERLEGLFS
jgi:hypothetical protein